MKKKKTFLLSLIKLENGKLQISNKKFSLSNEISVVKFHLVAFLCVKESFCEASENTNNLRRIFLVDKNLCKNYIWKCTKEAEMI